jgi:hypothetical protein
VPVSSRSGPVTSDTPPTHGPGNEKVRMGADCAVGAAAGASDQGMTACGRTPGGDRDR